MQLELIDKTFQKIFLCGDFDNEVVAGYVAAYTNSEYITMFGIYLKIKKGDIYLAEESLFRLGEEMIDKSGFWYLNAALLSLVRGNHDKADSFFERAMVTEDYYEKRWIYYEFIRYSIRKNYQQGVVLLEDALSIDTNFLPTLLEYAKSIDFYENPTGVLDIVNRIEEEIDCPNSDIYNLTAQAVLSKDHWQQSESYFLRALEVKETSDGYFGLALIYDIYNPDYQIARKYYKKALVINPYNFEARIAYLRFLQEGGLFSEFHVELEEALNVESETFENLLELMLLLVDLREFNKTELVVPKLVLLNDDFDISFLRYVIECAASEENKKTVVMAAKEIKNFEQRKLFESIVNVIWSEE